MTKAFATVWLSLILASCTANKPSPSSQVDLCNGSVCQVSLAPGATIFVEAEELNGQLGNWKVVADNKNPAKTIVLKLEQYPAPLGTMLNVTNPFQKMLKYHVEMMLPGEDQLRKTSSCPVVPNGGQSVEMWPHPISKLVMHDLRLLEANDDLVCEY